MRAGRYRGTAQIFLQGNNYYVLSSFVLFSIWYLRDFAAVKTSRHLYGVRLILTIILRVWQIPSRTKYLTFSNFSKVNPRYTDVYQTHYLGFLSLIRRPIFSTAISITLTVRVMSHSGCSTIMSNNFESLSRGHSFQ